MLAKASVLFRNTAPGQGYGTIGTVPLSDPGGERALAAVACDRVYGTLQNIVCLKTNRGLVTNFEAVVLNRGLAADQELGPAGHSQPDTDQSGRLPGRHHGVCLRALLRERGFSTATTITAAQGGSVTGNLEDFALMVNGDPRSTAADRNIWGVTFAPGQSDMFYATAASSGRIWLVRGSLSARTLTAIHDGVECPSLSPDGTRIAYKKNNGGTLAAHWTRRVPGPRHGKETVLSEQRSVDDQIEWLDNQTLLYGLPATAPRATATSGRSARIRLPAPACIIDHAWSPVELVRLSGSLSRARATRRATRLIALARRGTGQGLGQTSPYAGPWYVE